MSLPASDPAQRADLTVPPPIDRGRPPVYTLTALLLPLVLLYGPVWWRPHSHSVIVTTGLALVPVTLLTLFLAGLALRRHERWRWVGLAVLLANLTVFYVVVIRR